MPGPDNVTENSTPALPTGPSPSAAQKAAPRRTRRWRAGVFILLVVVVAVLLGTPRVGRLLRTVSTDDAYVNSHVTFVAPRVPGQVSRVLVDDNNRVRKGELLVQLDPEPYQVQVQIAEAAVRAAQADLVNVRAQTRGTEAQARSLRFGLQRAIEDVDNQVALLHSRVATLNARKATEDNAQTEYDRVLGLYKSSSAAKQEMDDATAALLVAKAQTQEALEGVHQVRVSLGLNPEPGSGGELTQVPSDLDQTFSAVRQAQASLIQAAAQLGVADSFDKTPRDMLSDFYKRDPEGNIDRIFAKLLDEAPAVKQAEARLAVAQRNLDETRLNLRYCDVVSEIDGVVTRREVNPGNNVVAGQALMAVRSLTEVWVDANFKETQLARLRIGLPVDLDVDMYGSSRRFAGRISGFTMGTGSTLALLPPENATGNFVKVVQRLPVRIELLDYDADKTPLFVGLSVKPSVRLYDSPTGPNAGQVLQPFQADAPTAGSNIGAAAASRGNTP